MRLVFNEQEEETMIFGDLHDYERERQLYPASIVRALDFFCYRGHWDIAVRQHIFGDLHSCFQLLLLKRHAVQFL